MNLKNFALVGATLNGSKLRLLPFCFGLWDVQVVIGNQPWLHLGKPPLQSLSSNSF
jgi:hypothetical protein